MRNATETATESMQPELDQLVAWLLRHGVCCPNGDPVTYRACDRAAAMDVSPAPQLDHRTRTFRLSYDTAMNWRTGRIVDADRTSRAECICGWSYYGDDRADARREAKSHRDDEAARTSRN